MNEGNTGILKEMSKLLKEIEIQKAGLNKLSAEIQESMDKFKVEIKENMSNFRTETNKGMNNSQNSMSEEFQQLNIKVDKLQTDMLTEMKKINDKIAEQNSLLSIKLFGK